MDKAKLFEPRAGTSSGLPEGDVEVPGLGTLRVRALNRGEVLFLQRMDDRAKAERYMLACAVIPDDGPLTEAEAGDWQKASPAGEIEPVTNKIAELSGILPDSAKEQYKSVPDGPSD